MESGLNDKGIPQRPSLSNENPPRRSTLSIDQGPKVAENKSLVSSIKEQWQNPELGAVREMFTMFLGAFYWWVTMLNDLLSPSDKTKTSVGYSWISLLLAVPIALLVAIATTYVHFIQENYHKNRVSKSITHSVGNRDQSVEQQVAGLSPVDESALSWWEKTRRSFTANDLLSIRQMTLLGLASLGHATDFVGFISNLTNAFLKDSLSKNALLGISLVYVLFGLAASRAEIRSCWSDMVKDTLLENHVFSQPPISDNASDKNTELRADMSTKISLTAKMIQTLTANAVFYAEFIDLVAGIETDTPIEVSTKALGIALVPALLIAVGSVYGQYFINLLQQSYHEIVPPQRSDATDRVQLTAKEEFLLANLPFGTAADFAEQLNYLVEPMLKSTPLKIGVQFTTIVVGLLTSGSAHMNAEKNLRAYKKIEGIYGEKSAFPVFSVPRCCTKKVDSPLGVGLMNGI